MFGWQKYLEGFEAPVSEPPRGAVESYAALVFGVSRVSKVELPSYVSCLEWGRLDIVQINKAFCRAEHTSVNILLCLRG